MFPRVTAVLVVQHGGDRLATTLEALRAQLRPSDALAVVLMRTDEATRALVAQAQPDHVVRLESALPFGRAVLAVESTLPAPASDDAALWLLTEDGAPEPGALDALVSTLTNVFTQNNLSTSVQAVVKGVIIVIAVLLQQRFASRPGSSRSS